MEICGLNSVTAPLLSVTVMTVSGKISLKLQVTMMGAALPVSKSVSPFWELLHTSSYFNSRMQTDSVEEGGIMAYVAVPLPTTTNSFSVISPKKGYSEIYGEDWILSGYHIDKPIDKVNMMYREIRPLHWPPSGEAR